MVIFSADLLEDKSKPLVAKTFQTSFGYMLVGIAEKHAKYEGYKSLNDYNQKNRMTRSCLNSYPFFIALSDRSVHERPFVHNDHGYSKALFNLFGDFYTSSYGAASLPSIRYMKAKNGHTTELNYFDINEISITVKNTKNYSDFFALKADILSENIDITDGATKFGDVKILSGDRCESKNLYDAIDEGIETVSCVSDDFFAANVRRLIGLSLYYPALNRRFKNGSEKLKFDEVKIPRP